MQVVETLTGDSPIVLGLPHGGTIVPEPITSRLNQTGRRLADTDWHITQLYDGILPGVSMVKSNIHRYVIDANRDPSGQSLYPGKNTTTLVPLTDFDGELIWLEGQEPSPDEIESRGISYHAPYHAALLQQLERVKARHGVAILFDCHSIRSNIPFLFEGELPIFNTGTNKGATCSALIESIVHDVARASGRAAVLNGCFKGGWTARHYGQPDTGIHAIQLEIAQRAYMHESPPWNWDMTQAKQLRALLHQMLENLSVLALSGTLQMEEYNQ